MKHNIERLFDPIQLKYIKSYEESAVGKYFYWDILGKQTRKRRYANSPNHYFY